MKVGKKKEKQEKNTTTTKQNNEPSRHQNKQEKPKSRSPSEIRSEPNKSRQQPTGFYWSEDEGREVWAPSRVVVRP